MSTLYELTEQYRYLYDLLSDGEIDEQTFRDSLDSVEFDLQFENKAEAYAKIIKMLSHDIESLKSEISRLSARKTALETNVKRMQDNLHNCMKLTRREKFKTLLFSFSIQANPDKLIVDDISELQNHIQWWKPRKRDESELDKTKIKEALLSGQKIQGVHLEKGESLRIK